MAQRSGKIKGAKEKYRPAKQEGEVYVVGIYEKPLNAYFMKACHLFRRLLPGLLLMPFLVRAENGGPIASNVPLNEISVRAYRYFHKAWPAIKDEVWYKTGKEYIVSFRNDPHHKKAYFNLSGFFLYSIEYYPGKDLSADVAGVVQKKYPGYQIGIVTQVSNQEKAIYYLKIENSTSIKTLSFIDGKLEVCEELINGGPSGS